MTLDVSLYEVGVQCINCGYHGPVLRITGTYVQASTCPLCCCPGRLRPDNDAWREEQENRHARSPWDR
jgi:hypothetical protein